MKKNTSNALRVQSWILVLAILLTQVSFVPLNVFAAPNVTESKTEGQVLAENYESLSAAEKAILSSGLLRGEVYTYNVPNDSDELVSVEQEDKKITATAFADMGYTWKPVSAEIWVGEEKEETVSLTDGVGTYTYGGDAFSVKVLYEVKVDVEGDSQNTLLNAGFELKQGLTDLETLYAQDVNLEKLEIALPVLMDLKDGYIIVGDGQFNFVDDPAAREAIVALNEQMSENGGKLTLRVLLAEYFASSSKTAFLLTKGASVKQALENDLADLKLIQQTVDAVDGFASIAVLMGYMEPSQQVAINNLATSMGTLMTAIEALAAADWTAAEKGTSMVKAGILQSEYEALDVFVTALGEKTEVSVDENLLLDTAAVQYNMSMSTVTVKVQLKVVTNNVDSDELVISQNVGTTSVTLKDGALKSEIEAAVLASGIENTTVSQWQGYIEEKYQRTQTALPDTLTDNVEYVITYSPKSYTVDCWGDSRVLPYGYKLTLPKHADENKAYDYFISGIYNEQGTVYTVVGNETITRQEGKAYTSKTLYDLIGDQYLNEKSSAIIKSGALKGNRVINVRYPENVLSLANDVLTAQNYASGYEGLVWVPTSYVINPSNETGTFVSNTITLPGEYESVDVIYTLELTNINNALEIANLPAKLAEEAAMQKSALNRMANKTDDMQLLKRAVMSALLETIVGNPNLDEPIPPCVLHEDPVKAAELTEYFKGVVTHIISDCYYGADLKLYTLFSSYNEAQNGGLAYYYKNSEAFINEITLLQTYLKEMLADEDKVAALTILLNEFGKPEYVEKINSLELLMEEVEESLTAPNAAIDTESENLGKLVTALQMTGSCDSFTVLPSPLALNTTLNQVAADKVAVSVTLVADGNSETVNVSVDKNGIISQDKINALLDLVNNKMEQMGLTGDKYVSFYTNDYTTSEIQALKDTDAKEIEFTYTWTEKEYTVVIDGEENQTVKYSDLEITLPSAQAGWRYDYTIDGAVVSQGTYTFTTQQLKTLFVNGTLTVTRTKVDVATEKFNAFIESLNAAGASNIDVTAQTVGNKTAVNVEIPPSIRRIKETIMPIAEALVTSGYEYVGLDGKDVMYMKDSALEISLQSIIDAFMADESFNIEKVIDVCTNGGMIFSTTLQLGTTETEIEKDVELNVLIKNPTDKTKKVATALEKVKTYVSFENKDGAMNFTLNLPDLVYEAYLAVLLVTDNINFANANEINNKIAMQFLYDYVKEVLANSEITTQTYTNTLNMLGIERFDFTQYENYYKYLRSLFNNCITVDIQDDINVVSVNIPAKKSIDKFMDELARPVLLNRIKEYKNNEDLKVSATATLTDIETDYEAIFVNVKSKDLKNIAGATTDLGSLNLDGVAAIVLLKDVDCDLTIKGRTLINLNGHNFSGTIKGDAKAYIVDSALEGNGNFSATGKNVVDMRDNKYYTATIDANNDVILTLNADLIAETQLPSLKELIGDAVTELAFNGYIYNKLYVEGNKVYELCYDDLVGLYASESRINEAFNSVLDFVNVEDIADLANMVIEDLADFGALKTAIENDEAFLTYSVATGTWNPKIEYVKDGDYLTVSMDTKENESRNLKIKLGGSEESKKFIVDMLEILEETTTLDASVEMHQSISDKTLSYEVLANAAASVDFSESKYGIALGVVIADGIGAPANAELVAAIKEYYTVNNVNALQAAFNKLTTAQMIEAAKNIGKNDTFAQMVENLGLSDVITTDINLLGEKAEPFARIAAALLRKLPIDGNSTTMKNFLVGTNTYLADKENFKRNVDATARGYTVEVDLIINKVEFSIDLFAQTVEIDYTELEEQIARAEDLTKEDYTQESWETLAPVLASAKEARNSNNQSIVDTAATNLKNTIDALVKMDYTMLEAQIARAEALEKDEYTQESWESVETALASAKEARNSKDQSVVDTAATNLKNAIDALGAMDYTMLEIQISRAEALEKDDYTQESWANLESVLASAKEARNSNDQSAVDTAATNLKNTIDALVKMDYTELEEQIARAEALEKDDYTQESWETLALVLAAAKEARNSKDQSVVDTAATNLKNAIDALAKMDYTELEEQISRAEDLTKEDYTQESWETLAPVLAAAKEARISKDQSVVDTAATNLKNTIDALVKMDYTELEEQISRAEALEKDDYTQESWESVETALASAKEARNSKDQSVVDTAATNLKNAIDALDEVLKPEINTPIVNDGWADVKGSKVDAVNKYIILDVNCDGITSGELKANLTVTATNDGVVTLNIVGEDSDIVKNGTTLKITAENSKHLTEVSYTVIILGDVNENGRIESGDAFKICEAFIGDGTLSENQELAADVNNNGRIDSGDATLNQKKFLNWDEYTSNWN